MSGNQADFSGDIPRDYDNGLGPILFAGYAADMARRAAASAGTTTRVLETAAGSGVLTRALRDALPVRAHLTATDLNAPMLDVARTKFRADEDVTFQPADAMALPFPDESFDTIVCQLGVMFYPDRTKAIGKRAASWCSAGVICSVCGIRTVTILLAGLRMK
jgi:ubiquinone/menaquinone biosynthesis C-methylase UbiE